MSFNPLTSLPPPFLENIIDLCKVKTFVWIQFLYRRGEITEIGFQPSSDIYFTIESINLIDVEFLGYESDRPNYYKLVLKHMNSYFVFKLGFEDIVPKNEKKQNNDYKFNNAFVYPDVLCFYRKIRSDIYTYKFPLNRFFCHFKFLFNGIVAIKKIILIERSGLQRLQSLTASPYTIQKMNANTLSYDDLSFIIFYHPTLNPFENTYGFHYHNTSPVSLVFIDTRIKRPRKMNSTS